MKPRFGRRFAASCRASPGSTLKLVLDLLLLASVGRRRTKRAAFAQEHQSSARIERKQLYGHLRPMPTSDPTLQTSGPRRV